MKLLDFNVYSSLVGEELDDFEQHVMASKLFVPSPGKPRIHMKTSIENVDILKQLINKYPLLSKWNIEILSKWNIEMLDADASIIDRAAHASKDNLEWEWKMSERYDLQTNLGRKLEAERYVKLEAKRNMERWLEEEAEKHAEWERMSEAEKDVGSGKVHEVRSEQEYGEVPE